MRHIRRLMQKAREAGAAVVHFSECALSGYGGTDFPSFEGYDWDRLRAETLAIMDMAGRRAGGLGLAPLTPPAGPQLLYLRVDRRSRNAGKRFCTPGA
jgi:hypothetical protein